MTFLLKQMWLCDPACSQGSLPGAAWVLLPAFQVGNSFPNQLAQWPGSPTGQPRQDAPPCYPRQRKLPRQVQVEQQGGNCSSITLLEIFEYWWLIMFSCSSMILKGRSGAWPRLGRPPAASLSLVTATRPQTTVSGSLYCNKTTWTPFLRTTMNR